MKKKLHTSVVLSKIARLEGAAYSLYDFYVCVFEDYPKIKKLFMDMRKEELSHQNQVLFQKRIVDKNPLQFGDLVVDVDIIDKMIEEVDAHVSNGVFELNDALDFAISFEESACEALIRSALSGQSDELSKLGKYLVGNDDAHVAKLKAMRREFEGRSTLIGDAEEC